jgi:sulfur relay (sulfurtransferase) complex TusBCD TusD component (DsrE family)
VRAIILTSFSEGIMMSMYMRTTITIEDDLAERLVRISRERQVAFKVVVNEALRRGLAEEAPQIPPFDYEPHAGNLLAGIDERRLNELAWQLDEERVRE